MFKFADIDGATYTFDIEKLGEAVTKAIVSIGNVAPTDNIDGIRGDVKHLLNDGDVFIDDENTCCFCGRPLESWADGNNPDPANTVPGKRCCSICNELIVIPARIYIHNRIHEVAGK